MQHIDVSTLERDKLKDILYLGTLNPGKHLPPCTSVKAWSFLARLFDY